MESVFDKMEKFVVGTIKKDNKINKGKSEENNNENMLKIINDYKNKKDWDKDEAEIIRK